MKLCIIGGSNSVLKDGYVPFLVAALEKSLDKKIDLVNLAIGGTFSHFGLWQVTAKDKHRSADVIVVEYALNDSELSRWRIAKQWARTYEGLIAKLRAEVPSAQIVAPLLTTQNIWDNPTFSEINSGVAFINERYGVTTVDCNQKLYDKSIAGELTPAVDLYRDPSHYSKKAHSLIGEMVASTVLQGHGRSSNANVLPISKGRYINAKSAVREGVFRKIFSQTERFEAFSNSLVSEEAYRIEQGDTVRFKIKGTLLALIVISVPNDGVIDFNFGGEKVLFSLRRTALDEGNFKFLVNVCVPDQYYRNATCVSKEFTPVEFRLASREQIADNSKTIMMRNTARLPDNVSHQLSVVDILYEGEIVID
ncbi:hypothetical protein BTH42_17050 [Burkholderia sp. SRS-W-2-2016]|uniref:SGNH/GDSL hydrolase family protein n=1 Tax=Burkholderia sp. SRS-W-2-2016 TaxID=1926878 RepID=UPI00094B0459|nr:SGNH/GDSL hydrolase family protein [Burkholderia sp. SRS-W-2-2016]OLL30460.1 hypothetical protein BTH42_17050 [Burkholderia sp. SRS-W-2-2016]